MLSFRHPQGLAGSVLANFIHYLTCYEISLPCFVFILLFERLRRMPSIRVTGRMTAAYMLINMNNKR